MALCSHPIPRCEPKMLPLPSGSGGDPCTDSRCVVARRKLTAVTLQRTLLELHAKSTQSSAYFVILRQRSPPRNEGLPTKSLCFSTSSITTQSKSGIEQAPGPRSSPQLPHGPTLPASDPALEVPFEGTANTESCVISFLPWHLGQFAFWLPYTIASNS